jgi:hypothetical protein
MELSAWIFMLAVWALIIGMTGYCFYKLMFSGADLSPEEEQAREEFHTL